jgi:FKBP-type peptidyl-prolyl cis-trans isomerase SlyD
MSITVNKVVTLDYTLTDDEGTVVDKSEGGNFLYLHGASNIIPGLEQALEGKAAGDELTVAVEPKDGYGERNDEMTQVVPREMFDSETEIQPGMQFHAQSPDGQMLVVTVVDVNDEKVTVDGNHPLAGVNLNFDVKVVDVRDATQEELDHGHVHGTGGHEH